MRYAVVVVAAVVVVVVASPALDAAKSPAAISAPVELAPDWTECAVPVPKIAGCQSDASSHREGGDWYCWKTKPCEPLVAVERLPRREAGA